MQKTSQPPGIVAASDEALPVLLSRIVEGATDAIFAKNLEGRYILVNAAAARVFGKDASEVIGRRDEDLFPAESAAETIENDRRVLARDQTETYESTNTLDGVRVCYLSTKFPYRDAAGAIAGVVGIARDVTARKEAEEAVRAQRDLFAAMVRAQSDLGVALVVLDGAERPRFINEAFSRITGYSLEEIARFPALEELLAPDQRHAIATRRSRREAGLLEPESYETAILAKSGTRIEIALSTKPLANATGDHLVMIRDVTAEKQTRARLMTADRTAAVGSLAAGVAHEVNNPLASVVINLDEIRQLVDDVAALPPADSARFAMLERLRSATRDAQVGAERIGAIVRDVSTFCRAPDESLTTIDVRETARSSVRLTDTTLRHRAELRVDLGVVPRVRGNDARVAQMIVNLLINAAEAVPDRGGRGEISLRTLQDDQGRAVIEVSDNGVGISPSNLPRVFDPFFTTKGPGAGPGLGLAVCQGIVRGMGGELLVTSELGVGSTFRVVLPASEPNVETSARVVHRVTQPARRARLLVIDDEVALAQALGRFLGREHDVTVCTDPREAMARLFDAAPYDLVLCDLMMAGLSGDELYELVLAREPALAARFVFLTGGAVTERTRAFVARMSDRCLMKPVQPQVLRSAVQEKLRSVGGVAGSSMEKPTS